MRLAAALLVLLLCRAAVADGDAMDCRPTMALRCTAEVACAEISAEDVDLRLWPERTPVDLCRASHCPPAEPSLYLCGGDFCGSGRLAWANERQDDGVRRGMAYLAPDSGPRLYTASFFAVAFEAASGTLALSRVHPAGQETTWFACAPAVDMD